MVVGLAAAGDRFLDVALAATGDIGRAHVVEMSVDTAAARQFERVARAVHVGVEDLFLVAVFVAE